MPKLKALDLSTLGRSMVVAGGANKSAFSISKEEFKKLLQTKDVVNSPAIPSPMNDNYIRIVDVGRTIGVDAKAGEIDTSTITVITDKAGNLVNTFPGSTDTFEKPGC